MQDDSSIMNQVEIKLKAAIRQGMKYTAKYAEESKSAPHLRSFATERNNNWKKESKKFLAENAPKTKDGKLNNDYYRYKFKYDVVVPKIVYDTILDYYKYSLEIGCVEDYEFIEKYIDHLMMFSQALFYYRDKYKSFIGSKRDKTPMYVKLLYNMLGRDYRQIVFFLQKLGLIDIDHMYVPAWRDYKTDSDRKGICKHYCFTVNLGDESYVYQITNRVIITKAYISDTRINEDVEYATSASSISRDKALNKYMSDNFDMSDDFSEYRHYDYNGYTYYYSRLDDEQRFKNFMIGRDSFGHRLYHPFLNMKGKARKFIEIDGMDDNKMMDIANSHPYFFSLLFDRNFLKYVGELLTDEEVALFESIIDDHIFKDKLNLFKKIVSSGRYYDFLRQNIKLPPQSLEMKKINMIYFYGPYNKRNAIYKFFDRNFNFINMVKYRIIRMSGYKRLCQILQRVEAKVMIDDLFFGLVNEGYKVIPFHDAIFCSPKDAGIVRKRMYDVFKKINVEYMPTFDKRGDIEKINDVFDKLKYEGGKKFIENVLLYENLNFVIKSVGIRNRVFRENMKPETVSYIDQRFEDMRDQIDDVVAERYYDLRMKMDMGETVEFDYAKMFEDYKKTTVKKKKFYAKDVVDMVKINPIEFMNYTYGTNYKTRVRENNYVY